MPVVLLPGRKGLECGRSILAFNAIITFELRLDLLWRCVERGAVRLGTIDGMVKSNFSLRSGRLFALFSFPLLFVL